MIDLSPGRAKRLDDLDLYYLGDLIGVGEDELHAVIDVESRGTGFDKLGRPLILFERHVFYRNLKGEKRKKAMAQKLAVRRWSRATYNQDQYTLLKRAIKIDETAALKACSWGMFQILGENYRSAGYATVQGMVNNFRDDEEEHLKAAISFIKNNNLDDELRNHEWAKFARGYNGPSYDKNNYDVKLARAYEKWSRIKDTTPQEPDPLVKEALAKSSFNGRVSKNITATGVATVTSQAEPILDVAERVTGLPIELPDWAPYVLGALFCAAVGFLIYDRLIIGRKADAGLEKLSA